MNKKINDDIFGVINKLSELEFLFVIKGSLALSLQNNLPHRTPQDIDLIINTDNSLKNNELIFKKLMRKFENIRVIHNNHFLRSFEVIWNDRKIKIEWITKHQIHKKWTIPWIFQLIQQ